MVWVNPNKEINVKDPVTLFFSIFWSFRENLIKLYMIILLLELKVYIVSLKVVYFTHFSDVNLIKRSFMTTWDSRIAVFVSTTNSFNFSRLLWILQEKVPLFFLVWNLDPLGSIRLFRCCTVLPDTVKQVKFEEIKESFFFN